MRLFIFDNMEIAEEMVDEIFGLGPSGCFMKHRGEWGEVEAWGVVGRWMGV